MNFADATFTFTLSERARPEVAEFGPEHLELFPYPRLSRKNFLSIFPGIQPPSFQPADGTVRRWWDPAAKALPPDEPYLFRSWILKNGAPYHKLFGITNEQASRPNLPGNADFPKYVVLPTSAVFSSIQEEQVVMVPVSAEALGLVALEDAEALRAEIGGEDLEELPHADVVWGTETRREWYVRWRSQKLRALELLLRKYKDGVGAPGHWDLSGANPVWISEVPDAGLGEQYPELSVPMRALKEDERFSPITFGGNLVVQRIDLLPRPATDQMASLASLHTKMDNLKLAVDAIQSSLSKLGH